MISLQYREVPSADGEDFKHRPLTGFDPSGDLHIAGDTVVSLRSIVRAR